MKSRISGDSFVMTDKGLMPTKALGAPEPPWTSLKHVALGTQYWWIDQSLRIQTDRTAGFLMEDEVEGLLYWGTRNSRRKFAFGAQDEGFLSLDEALAALKKKLELESFRERSKR